MPTLSYMCQFLPIILGPVHMGSQVPTLETQDTIKYILDSLQSYLNYFMQKILVTCVERFCSTQAPGLTSKKFAMQASMLCLGLGTWKFKMTSPKFHALNG